MVNKHSNDGYIQMLEGVQRKTTVYGDKTLMSKFLLSGGYTVPDHSHPYEQTGYLISGRMIFRIGDEEIEVQTGDSWSIPADVVHGTRMLEDCVVLEVFSPARQDYMPDK